MEIKYHNICECCKDLFWTKDAWQSFCEDCLEKCKHKNKTWDEDIGADVCDDCNERVI